MNFKVFFQIWLVKMLFPKYWKLPTSLIYGQSRLETGNFWSNIYKENKNLFGMKKPSIRKTKVVGENRGHATYLTHWGSIYDYFLRQKHFNINYENKRQYIDDTQSSGYAEDLEYKEKWWNNYKVNRNLLGVLPYLLIPALAVAIILLWKPEILDELF